MLTSGENLTVLTSIWFTEGIGKPALRISSRCLTPLHPRGNFVSCKGTDGTKSRGTHKLDTPTVRTLPAFCASNSARYVCSRSSFPLNGSWIRYKSMWSVHRGGKCTATSDIPASARTHAEPLQRNIYGVQGALVAVRFTDALRRCTAHQHGVTLARRSWKFWRNTLTDKHVFSSQPACAEGRADMRLVPVCLGGVHMSGDRAIFSDRMISAERVVIYVGTLPVPRFECFEDGVVRGVVLVDSEAKVGHLVTC